MRFYTFDWDASNVEHIARHDLEPSDAEEVCRGRPLTLRGRESRYLVYGRTVDGRYVLVVLRSLGEGRARVLTARDMTGSERRLYQRRH